MALIAFNWNPTTSQLKWFGCLWFPLFLVMVIVFGFKAFVTPPAVILAAVAVLSFVLGAAVPQLLKPIFVGLLLITFPIGFVVSHAVLAVLFFLFLTPMAFLMRVFGHDPLHLTFAREAPSYWVLRQGRSEMARYFHQF